MSELVIILVILEGMGDKYVNEHYLQMPLRVYLAFS